MTLLYIPLLSLAAEAINFGPFGTPEKPYPQETVDSKNVLKYTGWQGPYSDRRGYGINRDPPAGTRVDQVVQLTRHSERWPDPYDFDEQYTTLKKFLKHKGELNGSVAFVNEWEPYTNTHSGWLSEESLLGPYSGLLQSYKLGTQARQRYYDLYDGQSTLPIFASGYERIVDTARKFGEGFLQWNYTTLAAVNIIQETADQGANSLVPSCKANFTTETYCSYPKNSTESNAPWLYPQYDAAVERLNKQNPQLKLERADIPHLIGGAAFELNVRGSSPWVDVFTAEEWSAFEYAQSSYYYCFYGPGSTTGPSQGSIFLNATRTLLVDGPKKGLPLYFAFAHDTDIVHLTAAIGIDAIDNWNAEEVQFGQKWDVTDLTPQGAHIVFERLVAAENSSEKLEKTSEWASEFPGAFNVTSNISVLTPTNATSNSTSAPAPNSTTSNSTTSPLPGNVYVRIIINEAVVPLKSCSSGPGYSCPLSEFNRFVDERLDAIPPYKELCNIPKGSPESLSFFWNYNTTTDLDVAEDLSYQKGLVSWDDKPIKE